MSQIFNFPNLGSVASPFGSTALPNLTMVPIYSTNLGTGNTALYTVPVGKKAIVLATLHQPTAGGTVTSNTLVSYDAGVTFVVTNGAFSTAANASGLATFGYIYNPGDVVGISANATGLNVIGTAYVFDSSAPIKSVHLTSFTNGNNTLYTCPAGKTATLIFGWGNILSGNATAPRVFVSTTGADTVSINFVLTGGTVATGNQVFTASVASSINGVNGPWTMSAGDFININVSSGANTAHAWTNILEQ